MTREEKLELVQRLLGLNHKLKVHDSMKAPETHEEHSISLIARWELEDEIKAIAAILDEERAKNVKVKAKLVEEQYLSGKPIEKKKK